MSDVIKAVLYQLTYAMGCEDPEWKNKQMSIAIKLLAAARETRQSEFVNYFSEN